MGANTLEFWTSCLVRPHMAGNDNKLGEAFSMFTYRSLPVTFGAVLLLCGTVGLQPVGADQGSDVAERLCGTCHGGGSGLQMTAPLLGEVAGRVDWSNVKMREWMAAEHRFAPALSANAAELEALRRHLEAIRRDSFLGGLDQLN